MGGPINMASVAAGLNRARPSLATCKRGEIAALRDALLSVDTRELIFTAGALNNTTLFAGCGSAERAIWFEGRRAADPAAQNPYWPDR